MHEFLSNNRDELIARCKRKVEQRPKRAATTQQLTNGIPLFLEQLTRTLRAEEADDDAESLRISGPSGGDMLALSEMGVTATAHGKELLEMGYAVDQVVHDYGDLCQSITDLAFERDAPFAVNEFRTLNRCLDNAIADAVTEFSFQREANVATKYKAEETQRTGFLVHELRNALSAANLSLRALEVSHMPVSGATGALLKRSLATMRSLIAGAVNEVRSRAPEHRETLSVASFIADAKDAGQLQANAKGCVLEVQDVDPTLGVRVDRDILLAALANLLQNGFKFTRPHTSVTLRVRATTDRVLIEVEDECGGLPTQHSDELFRPFEQRSADRSGLGLGLAFCRWAVELSHGVISTRNLPGEGCVFTVDLPRCRTLAAA